MTIGKLVDVSVVDTTKTPYELFPCSLKMVYRAGFTNPWHSLFCGHGFFVLEGVLDTHQGQYGAGSWVWFPEGGLMYHGATKEQDVTFLFVTNKKFSIHFVGDEGDPCALEMAAVDAQRKES
ncbi:membrane protein [Zymoseptoria brevis]|uniref:Membrane protein n=1 Tax=Zymoseptoria brevis TaxID=1047168 RepID=A0A0F4GH41_9PEZI|nr:membrane protein [Zymoseptoria brevis]